MLWDAGSFGSARALTVLAEKELGRATAVYDRFSPRWSDRSVEPVELPTLSARDHLAKFRAAFEFGRELETFWGDEYPGPPNDWDRWHAEQKAVAEAAARAANAEK
jgi:AbiV family abortive infection protein